MTAKRRTKQALADEAWLKAQQFDLSGDLESEAPSVTPITTTAVPSECPHCHRSMNLAHGWTISRAENRLLCGQCGGSVVVPQSALDRFRRDLHDFFAARAAKLSSPAKARARVRGGR